ncbi:centrosomal protein [Reticulomyxa filosa]|uniref:Centrosomal protein n=1 Tax=Reticulomyxa filosa TaxID=46433 RepID=X6MFW6_RETFI|nr:centrosomal protein [Reticulomyxa filosa]|eukprot:ETO12576.1 centrosomal protein [Reticulomyxa filosa]
MPTITITNTPVSTAKTTKPACGKPHVLEDSDDNNSSVGNEPATSNVHSKDDADDHDDEKHATNGGSVGNARTLAATLSPVPTSSTKRVMKVWRSKAQNFNVYNYLIVDDFGLSGPMIDGHFLRTQPSVGMTEHDKQTISNQSHDHNLNPNTNTNVNIDHDQDHDNDHHSHSRKHTRSKLSTTSTITPHPVDDTLDADIVLQHQNSDVDRRRDEEGDEQQNGSVGNHDDDGNNDNDDEEEQEWEDESSEGTRERNALLASIDPDILMMIPSAQD